MGICALRKLLSTHWQVIAPHPSFETPISTLFCRFLEAYIVVSATTRFAVGCGVHMSGRGLTVPDSHEPRRSESRLIPLSNSQEAKEKEKEELSIMWRVVYLVDRSLSRDSGYPSSVPKEVSGLGHHGSWIAG